MINKLAVQKPGCTKNFVQKTSFEELIKKNKHTSYEISKLTNY
ncbi:37526_t:CDS:2 [Gigaspora margarita]|uniref:37526_t:CDS:1 n=1 Tax=Gigaspora margarita TaxID=4874 RepID=A0ABN7UN50_GIGMA|nr:37526_t:CDS:2 [Gigaspora margarita]